MFQIATDRGETADVAREIPKVVADLGGKLDAWLARRQLAAYRP